MFMLACPRSSCTYLGCLPATRSIVAQVCRRSCSLMAGIPALFNKGLKCLPRRFVYVMVVPVAAVVGCAKDVGVVTSIDPVRDPGPVALVEVVLPVGPRARPPS